jgi:hypothetical protein
LLIIVFAVLLSIGSMSIVGLPLLIVVSSWFFKYAYVLFDHTSRGFDEPPVLDIAMLNPVSEQRPLAQLAILVILGSVIAAAKVYVGLWAAVLLGVVVLFFLPASVAILGLESNPFKAMYPVAWVSMMQGLGSSYLLILGLIAVEFVLLALLRRVGLWAVVTNALDMFAVLSVFSVLAGALYDRRHEMHLDVYVSPEQEAEKQRKAELRLNEKLVLEAYGLMRADAHVKSWQLMHDWVVSRGSEPHDLEWLAERVASWEDSRYATRFTEELIERLVVLKKNSEALKALDRRLAVDPKFRPKSAADTLSLAQLAARGGGAPRLARVLLSDFAARFPGDPRVGVADALARHLA